MGIADQLQAAPMRERQPLVSVVIPTYNRAHLLLETVNSVLAQTLQDFEIIIVDNMSGDNTENEIRAMGDARIRYFRNANGGVIAVNRNFGICHARGRYIAFCDDDDIWMPEKLQYQVAEMEKNPEVGLCYTDGLTFRNGEVIHRHMVRKKIWANHFRHLLWENCVPSSSVMVRKDVFKLTGLLNEQPVLVAVEDYEMWLRISRIAKFAYIDSILIKYRLHNNFSGAKLSNIALKNILVLKEINRKLKVGFFLTLRSVLHQYLKYFYFKFCGK